MVKKISCHGNTLQFLLCKDEDPRVAETAVVGYGHEDYGEGTYLTSMYLVVTKETKITSVKIIPILTGCTSINLSPCFI